MPIINGQLLETIDITQNGRYDIAKYTSANVNVSGGGSGNIESLNITPSTSEQTISPTSEIDGYAPIHVSAVTSSIDSNIISKNIKSGVNILGVTGNYIGENKGYLIDNEGNFVNILQNHIDSGVTNPINLSQIKHINNYSFNFLYDSFYDRNKFSLGKPPRVDLNNLETITGTYSCRNAFSNNYHFYNNMMHGVGNINMGKLTSITGDYTCYNMFQDSLFLTLDLSSLTTISGEYTCYGMFENSRHVVREPEPVESDSSESESLDDEINENINWEDWEREYSTINGGWATCANMFKNFSMVNDGYQRVHGTTISFPSLETLGISSESVTNTFYSAFNSTEGIDIIEFPNLKSIEGMSVFTNAFCNSLDLTEIQFPLLTTINGQYIFSKAFNDIYNPIDDSIFTEIRFPSLKSIEGKNNFELAFTNSNNLQHIYFDSLETINDGSTHYYKDNFKNMLKDLDGVTLHFPSGLSQSVISVLDTYPNFGGTNTTILFDL